MTMRLPMQSSSSRSSSRTVGVIRQTCQPFSSSISVNGRPEDHRAVLDLVPRGIDAADPGAVDVVHAVADRPRPRSVIRVKLLDGGAAFQESRRTAPAGSGSRARRSCGTALPAASRGDDEDLVRPEGLEVRSTLALRPVRAAMTAVTDATPMTMPMVVRAERVLFAQICPSASRMLCISRTVSTNGAVSSRSMYISLSRA